MRTLNLARILLISIVLTSLSYAVTPTAGEAKGSGNSAASSPVMPDTTGAVRAAMTQPARPGFLVRVAEGNRLTGGGYGHGICLDAPCVHVLTNYHVAGLLPGATVEGVGIKKIQFATGPEDSGAVPIQVMGTLRSWNPQRDMALLTLKKPLPGQFTAARFADYAPAAGTPVVRYPTTSEVYSGKLVHNGRIRYLDGTGVRHEMDSMLLSNFDSPAGVSGGALCDAEGRVIGLNELQTGSIAIPVPVISAFLLGTDPELWNRLHLHQTSPVDDTPDERLEANDVPPITFRLSNDPESAVRALVEHASDMRQRMTHVIAKSEIRQSGPGVTGQPTRYEVALYGAGIRFRRVFENGQLGPEIPDVPLPTAGVVPGADWDYFLDGLKRATVTYEGETLYGNDIARVFHFAKLTCPWRETRATGTWAGTVKCSGEVMTDLDYHPIVIKAGFDFAPDSIMSQLHFEIQFQRFSLGDGKVYELPAQVDVKAKYKRSFGTYKASNSLTAYRPFGVEHVIRAD